MGRVGVFMAGVMSVPTLEGAYCIVNDAERWKDQEYVVSPGLGYIDAGESGARS